MPPLSLAYLTYAPLPAPEAVSLAARLGYDAVGLRTLPNGTGGVHDRLVEDRSLLRETLARLRDTGVTVFDVEIVRIGEGFDPAPFRAFLENCQALGARAILVAGDDPDEARLTASYARFCEAAAPCGLTADLEFMPWTRVPDARTALRVVRNAAQPNGRVLVDSLHAGRSATSLADLAGLPAELLSYAQICDAPGDVPATEAGLIHTAREARLLPGDGGIDLVGIFSQLPADLPVSVEIPNLASSAALGVEAWTAAALARTRTTLDRRDAAVARGASLRKAMS